MTAMYYGAVLEDAIVPLQANHRFKIATMHCSGGFETSALGISFALN